MLPLVSLVGLAASFPAPHRVVEVRPMSEYARAAATADVAVGDVLIVWRGDSKLDFTRRFRHAELERHAGAPCAFTRVSESIERVTSPAANLLAAAAQCVTVREACTATS